MENVIKVLVVVDMQNDFIDGTLGTEEAKAIVPNVVEKIKEYKNKENSIIFATLDTHTDEYMERQEGKNLPVPHCIVRSDGWELNNNVKAVLGHDNIPILKSTFGSSKLANMIKNEYEKNVESDFEIELCGLCSDICVVSNALLLKAYIPEVPITVDAKCVAGVTPESNKAALTTMKMCQINVINWNKEDE